MGLDMYLTSDHYIQNWDFQKPEERHTITILKGDKPSDIPVDRIESVVVSEAYWRKANAIHAWFVKNVQDGRDDCGHYYVNTEQLAKLLKCVKKVLANHDLAPSLLPTQQGCFFGSYDYDQYYFDDLKYTKTELERILSKKSTGDFYYHSSW